MVNEIKGGNMSFLKDIAEAAMEQKVNNVKSNKKIKGMCPCILTLSTTLIFSTIATVNGATQFQGNLNTVSITDAAGTNSSPTAEFSYTQSGQTLSFDAGASSDADGSIVEYKWDFGDGNLVSGQTADFTPSNSDPVTVTLTVVDDGGGVTLKQKQVSLTPPVDIRINFQPTTAPVVSGYLVDSGKAMDSAVGYGWSGPLPGIYVRNSSLSPDSTYDTLAWAAATAVWEHAIDNGTYNVSIGVGDPAKDPGSMFVQAEGVTVIDAFSMGADRWDEQTASVTVDDGKLTLTFTGTPIRTAICWVKITSM